MLPGLLLRAARLCGATASETLVVAFCGSPQKQWPYREHRLSLRSTPSLHALASVQLARIWPGSAAAPCSASRQQDPLMPGRSSQPLLPVQSSGAAAEGRAAAHAAAGVGAGPAAALSGGGPPSEEQAASQRPAGAHLLGKGHVLLSGKGAFCLPGHNRSLSGCTCHFCLPAWLRTGSTCTVGVCWRSRAQITLCGCLAVAGSCCAWIAVSASSACSCAGPSDSFVHTCSLTAAHKGRLLSDV